MQLLKLVLSNSSLNLEEKKVESSEYNHIVVPCYTWEQNPGSYFVILLFQLRNHRNSPHLSINFRAAHKPQ